MPVSKEEKEFVTYVVDMMHSIGPVHAKGMFGGHGIFLDGLMFALIADSTLYLKSDESIAQELNARGLEAFTYYKEGKAFTMSYHRAPDEVLEDPEEMYLWAKRAFAAALKAARGKKRSQS